MSEPLNVCRKLIESHLVDGTMVPGSDIAIRIDQTLTQDATGTLVMLELEAMGLERTKAEVSVQYVDHNVLSTDFKNQDDHLFLRSACQRFGLWYSRAGNGVSHPVHMERFGIPGKSLVGSDSHTPAAGSMGMLAIGSGGLDVAFAIAGDPLFLRMPKVLGVELTGRLPDWVSAKDVVLEMLRRYDVNGCRGFVIEYYGPGLASLSAMDRHVIANMGTEMGATSSVFPSDEETRRFLIAQGRGDDWVELSADPGATYDVHDAIDLSQLVPLIACPSSPGNVVEVRAMAGKAVHQVMIGSSANPGLRDFWIAAEIMAGRMANDQVSFDVNPTSRQLIENLAASGALQKLVHAGARFHQAGCNGCIGMGQAPATDKISLRTVPRNFPGRSGTKKDQVYLCSPETAAAAALTGVITDPRDLEDWLDLSYPRFVPPVREIINTEMLVAPIPAEAAAKVDLERGPNIQVLPQLERLSDAYEVPVLLKVGNNISTDEILPGGTEVMSFRSNIPKISTFCYAALDDGFAQRARIASTEHGGHVVVAGENYAQGSSREHAALGVRYLGQVAVLAKSYARIGWQNLANFGVVPLEFVDPQDYDRIQPGDVIVLKGLRAALMEGTSVVAIDRTHDRRIGLLHRLSRRQVEVVLAGGVLNKIRDRLVHELKDVRGVTEGVRQPP